MDADSVGALPPSDDLQLAVEIFRILSDGTRLRILWCLLDRERSVSELADLVGKSPSVASQHLAKLRLAHLVQTRREGVTIYYQLTSDHVRQLVVDGVHQAEHQRPETPGHHTGGGVTALRRRTGTS